ncbi:hypothetical protein PPGU19_019620 [Paraburkholderia sp. PGU19]|nr:hypothetical protein PPGU19_019620 [Paraburkholderia sp. PGU19]
MNVTRPTSSSAAPTWPIFVLLAIAGLFYVKWFPYYNRAFTAASTHSIGASILMGKASSPPAPSWSAALAYALAYGKAIWQAMVLGLLLGSAVQALLPAHWVARLLGKTGFGSVAAGGLLALPGMMCTCCAAPVVAGLRARQASPGGAIAFWLGNSVLNPATLVFMGFVLGWHWAGLRLVLGVAMVFGLGYLANRLVTPRKRKRPTRASSNWSASSVTAIRSRAGCLSSRGWPCASCRNTSCWSCCLARHARGSFRRSGRRSATTSYGSWRWPSRACCS